MSLKRIIPVLLIKDGNLVRSSDFSDHRFVGDPFKQCERFNSWQIDEITYLDIDRERKISDGFRTDKRARRIREIGDIQRFVSQICQVPLAWGGNLRTESDAGRAIEVFGADKVIFTSAVDSSPSAVSATAKRFGSQAICCGIDFRIIDGKPQVFVEAGRKLIRHSFEEWLTFCLELGAGEILLHAIDRDGKKCGYDIEVLQVATGLTKVPIVVLGGAGNPNHMVDAVKNGASGAAASNVWHFVDNFSEMIRENFVQSGIEIRQP